MKILLVALLLFCAGCAGFSKSWSKMGNSMTGSDWIVTQYRQDGSPFHCWKLKNAVVESSEGGNVDWKDPRDGHLVYLTGWENRVQVKDGNFDGAARLIGVNASLCGNGPYPDSTQKDQ